MRIEPKKIMCAIDFSDFTNSILSYGKALAAEFDSKLCLCHVVPGIHMVTSHMPPYLDYQDIESERIRNCKDRLEKMAKELDIKCETMVAAGHPADQIEHFVRENNVDMVIAATHGGSGVKRFLIGSVTNRLMKILSCPLLVLHTHEHPLISPVKDGIKLERILVGCDFSKDSELAFDYALSLAQEFQSQLYLAHVMKQKKDVELSTVDPKDSRERNHIEKQLADMVPEESRNWCTPVTVMLEGQPYKKLIEYAEKNKMDMIILGVRGHGLLEEFIVGSTTDRVISRASCPVLAVRRSQ